MLAPAAHAGIPKKYFKGKATTEVGIKAPPESPAQELAEKYVPIAEIREETDPPCDTSEEQYQPTSVETVLGNPTVLLQHDAEGGKLTTVRRAPTAQQIAGLGEGWYLNLEGKALGNTCVYAKAFKKLLAEGKAPAVTYAHIAREEGHSGFALQYWFFWYFNQFNDLHEGDWEGMQITFEANSPAAALHEEPGEIILFQHAGGERAKWEDGKVQKEGTHPIVYPAAGSHATFYDSAVYVENGQHGSGLGCDNTTEPLRELTLRPILMPEAVKSKGPFAWTSYYGRWGEKEKGFNNGPTGPQTKTQWREPFTWMAAQRTTSPRLPGGTIAGPQVTKAFCGAVATASELINLDAQSPPAGDPHDRRRARPDHRLRRLHQVAPGGHRHAAPAARARPDPARLAPVLRPPLAGAGADRALRPGADRRRQLLRRPDHRIDPARQLRHPPRLGRHARTVRPADRPGAGRGGRDRGRAGSAALAPRRLPPGAPRGARTLLARRLRPAPGDARRAAAGADRDRPPLRPLEAGQLVVRPAGSDVHRQELPRVLPGELGAGPRPLVPHRAGRPRLLRDQRRGGADADLRADLHGAAADLDQRDRLARLRPADPLRGDGRDVPLSGPRRARGSRTGGAPAGLATVGEDGACHELRMFQVPRRANCLAASSAICTGTWTRPPSWSRCRPTPTS